MKPFPSAVKLRQVQYFLAAAELLHFSRAAERLFVTQPTLSHQLAELETQLGTVLFDRAGKNVRLTQAGEVFKLYATRAVKELQAGQTALAELDGMVRGTVRIGVIQSFSRTLLPPILGQFTGSYPAIKLTVEEMTATAIEHAVNSGNLDLGIAFAPSEHEDVEIEPILRERLLAVVGATHPFAKLRSISLADLDGQRMALLSREFSTRRLIDRYLEKASAKPEIVCETNSIVIMLGMVSESGLVTIIPENAIVKATGIKVLALKNPVPIRTAALLWPRYAYRTVAARTFAQLVCDRFRSEPKRI